MDLELALSKGNLLHKYNNSLLADDSLTDVEVLLLSLHLFEKKNKRLGTYDEVKELFLSLGRKENNFKVAVHRAKKQGYLKEEGNIFSFLTKGLKRIGEMVEVSKSPGFYIVKSGEHFTATKQFEIFLQSEIKNGEILLVDPYISPDTLHPFSVLKESLKSLRILTSNIYEEEKFKEYKKKFEKEIAKIEIKKNPKIHDRWLICGGKCWSIGGSIKDLGNKDTIIKELEGVTNDLRELFDLRWNDGQ